jgi:tRNA-splicing ligase RtcB (3'-phosphate/5'-hydroxy nucleic acid ligase)
MRALFEEGKQSVPIKLWLDDIEEGAMQQIFNLSNLPFAFKHIAVMPDSHQGYGMPIGGVLATQGVVIPNAVGVDIGCGMCTLKTSLTELSKEQIRRIFGGSKEYQGGIRSAIPVGFNHQSKKQDEALMPMSFSDVKEIGMTIIERQYESALKQIGTLGSGNHFIELQKGSDGFIWVMIHSGSRNLGKQVADYYNKLAIELNERWYSAVPKKWELAFLPMDSMEGKAYLREMNFCVDFALANRKLMMEQIKRCIYEVCPEALFDPMINIAHNYAQMENHFGKNVMIHRKGATLARQDTVGIIPGSQGTKSYIVKGKGNEESFMSCSHGAGRKMSRTKAQNELSLEDEIRKLDEQGIVHGVRHKNDLDEASGAYKDIDVVMNNQKDLVEILVELTPLAVIKG